MLPCERVFDTTMKKIIYSVYAMIKDFRLNEYLLKSNKFDENRIAAEIVRNVHSIAKGLCIKNSRAGFGVKKINEMFSLTEKYMQITDDKTILYFVLDAVKEYLNCQKSVGFDSQDIKEISEKNRQLEEKLGSHDEICGGTIELCRDQVVFDETEIERLFETRHSIREFSGEPVPEELLLKAIKLAQRAPSACNRQAVRIYSISSVDYIKTVGNLDGIGGFAEDVDKFVLITGVRSAYRAGEKNQFAVSASMYAAYLTLSLNLYGIGACAIQRSLFPDKAFVKFRETYEIPEDEQLVVMLGVGMLKDKVKVPVSKRYPTEKIYKKLNI